MVMKMAVEMAAVSMEKPSGHFPVRQGAGTETLSPDLGWRRLWNFSRIVAFSQAGEIDNLTHVGTKYFDCVVQFHVGASRCCAALHSFTNNLHVLLDSYWFDNLGFILRENLLLYASHLPLGFPTNVCQLHASLVLLALFFLRTGAIDAVLVVSVGALHRPQTGGEGGAGDAQHEAWWQRQPAAAWEARRRPHHPEAGGEGGAGGTVAARSTSGSTAHRHDDPEDARRAAFLASMNDKDAGGATSTRRSPCPSATASRRWTSPTTARQTKRLGEGRAHRRARQAGGRHRRHVQLPAVLRRLRPPQVVLD
ncbi:hypothetical protein QYE76_062608 [Lolium multiflorum]|uniref:Uncharacterized protein n=1 Tax=Lolium multiflorum TaxID=4521 RepID=A0AAD8S4T6_LOLMU|nr:hypothetical protein QYE76_062608 [Lolium multiflorum]